MPLLTLLARSVFHAYFSATLELFCKYSLGIRLSKAAFLTLLLSIAVPKEYIEHLLKFSDNLMSVQTLLRDSSLVATSLILTVFLRKRHVSVGKFFTFLLCFQILATGIGSLYTSHLPGKEYVWYKHFIDIGSLLAGPLFVSALLERFVSRST